MYKEEKVCCDNRRTYILEVCIDLRSLFFSDETVVFCTVNVLFIHVINLMNVIWVKLFTV